MSSERRRSRVSETCRGGVSLPLPEASPWIPGYNTVCGIFWMTEPIIGDLYAQNAHTCTCTRHMDFAQSFSVRRIHFLKGAPATAQQLTSLPHIHGLRVWIFQLSQGYFSWKWAPIQCTTSANLQKARQALARAPGDTWKPEPATPSCTDQL